MNEARRLSWNVRPGKESAPGHPLVAFTLTLLFGMSSPPGKPRIYSDGWRVAQTVVVAVHRFFRWAKHNPCFHVCATWGMVRVPIPPEKRGYFVKKSRMPLTTSA